MIAIAASSTRYIMAAFQKVAAVALVLSMLMPVFAHAQGDLYDNTHRANPSESAAISTIMGTCPTNPDALVANCDCYPGLANRVVGCIRQTLHNASERFFDPDTGIHSIVARAIGGMLTLGIAIYGVMIAAGMVERLNRDTFTLLIKVAFVTYFVVNTQMLYNLLLVAIDMLATDMFQFSTSGLFGQCMTQGTVWERMDCMIDSILGIKVSEFTNSSFQGFNDHIVGEMIQRGLIGTFFQIMKSSTFGVLIGIMGFIFVYTMLFFVVRVLFAFLMSFISLTFLLMIGPIFIPMVIFRVTKQYFDKWVRLIISSCLQPIILVAFITFSVAGLDLVMFSGPTAITRVIAGNKVDEANFNLHAYINQYLVKTAVKAPEVKGESSVQDFQQTAGSIKSFVQATTTDCLSNTIGFVTSSIKPGEVAPPRPQAGVNNLVDCTRAQVNQLPYQALDLTRLAAARIPPVDQGAATQAQNALAILQNNPEDENAKNQLRAANEILNQKMTQELFASAAVALMMVFLMNTLMKVVPVLSNDLTGEFRYTPSFIGGKGGGLDSQLASQISSNMRSMAGGNRQ